MVGLYVVQRSLCLPSSSNGFWVPWPKVRRHGFLATCSCEPAHAPWSWACWRTPASTSHGCHVVAQESLLVYLVHLCVVYGSIWNQGLYRFHGEVLSPPASVITAIAVVVPMIVLALLWNGLKHSRPVVAKRVKVLAGIGLIVSLL